MKIREVLLAALVIPAGRPSIEIDGFHLVQSQAARRDLEIIARSARMYKVENVAALEAVRCRVWGEGPKPFEITGPTAVLDSGSEDFEIHQSSHILTPDGFHLNTTGLAYVAHEHKLHSNAAIRAYQGHSPAKSNLTLTGEGLNVDLDKSLYDIRHNVRAEQQVSKKSSLTIRSATAQMQPASSLATFVRNVTLQTEELELKGERLLLHFTKGGSDEKDSAPAKPQKLLLDSPNPRKGPPRKISANLKGMKIISNGFNVDFDNEGGVKTGEAVGAVDALSTENVKMNTERLTSEMISGHQRVLMHGTVTIQTGERTGKCEEAEYWPESGDIVLRRIASVQRGGQLLEGEVIRYSTKNSEIIVEKARGQMDKKEATGN